MTLLKLPAESWFGEAISAHISRTHAFVTWICAIQTIDFLVDMEMPHSAFGDVLGVTNANFHDLPERNWRCRREYGCVALVPER
ncbi:hypothetical protein AB3X91_40220 [Paraburkholderia sp. BR14263]|uniref:hypothetical protein n=1 Tax=unclassified Paraburkholderia TaxID=2615204 RepID=UPI0034CF8C1A